jgi:hypothetical protein
MMPRQPFSKLYVPPESHVEIAQYAKTLLVRGDCLGVLPTPVQHLYTVGNVEEVELDRAEMASLLERFSQAAKNTISAIWSKVRGAADLKRRVIFMPDDDKQPRMLFARAHELGHQTLPWHYIRSEFLDDDRTLSPSVSAQFEIEANLFAAELIYQGERFTRLAREYRPSFAAVFELAHIHGASRQATFWQFVQVHDDAVAGLVYYPRSRHDGLSSLEGDFFAQKEVRSESFSARYGGITFDGRLDPQHPWALARFEQRPACGELPMLVEGRAETFLWEAFYNRHCLMVLIRRRPGLQLLGSVLQRLQLPPRR